MIFRYGITALACHPEQNEQKMQKIEVSLKNKFLFLRRAFICMIQFIRDERGERMMKKGEIK